MSASIKSARAGAIVNCAIFGQAGTDEIDLELVEGTYQVPMWHNGKRLEKNKDVTWTLADSSRELASWVFDDRHVVPFGRVHDYTVNWDTEQLTWSIDGKKLLDVKKLPQGAWPDQPLPFRWGPWAASKSWIISAKLTKAELNVSCFRRYLGRQIKLDDESGTCNAAHKYCN